MKKIAMLMVISTIAAAGLFAATPRHQEGPKKQPHHEVTAKKENAKKKPAKAKSETHELKKTSKAPKN